MAKIILFDIDSTLVATNHAGRAAMDVAFAETFGVADATEGVSFPGRTDHAIFMEIIAVHHLADGDPEAAYARAKAAYLRDFRASIERLGGKVLPGVRELLDAMSATYRPGLATGNMRRGAEAKLKYFGLWHYFAGGGFGDDSPVRADLVKQGIEEMAGVLDIDARPQECIVLGDTPLDVEAAHQAGARALAVATGRSGVEELRASRAEWVLEDLSDTDAVLGIFGS